jgi:hypothetical protein
LLRVVRSSARGNGVLGYWGCRHPLTPLASRSAVSTCQPRRFALVVSRVDRENYGVPAFALFPLSISCGPTK